MLPLLLFAAAMNCPVLTTPTARGAIGDVQVKVSHSGKDAEKDSYTCQFTGADSELVIEVSTLASAGQFAHFAETACDGAHGKTALKGIGNEAVACTLDAAEKIAGRVRNQAFLIRLTKSSRSVARDIAETVAGNLF
jgi:hypothetical protein